MRHPPGGRALIALVAAACLGGRAIGDETDPATAAIGHLNRGHELYTAGRLDLAVTEFEQAHALVPERATPYRWLGMTEAALGRCADAIVHLAAFLDRSQPGDPRVAEVRALRDHCLRQLSPAVGTLEVESRPTGAEVFVDDEPAPLGRTPYRQEGLAPGDHVVALRRAGHLPARRDLRIERDQIVRLAVDLQPLIVPPPRPPPVPLHRRWQLWLGVTAGTLLLAATTVATVVFWPPTETILPPFPP